MDYIDVSEISTERIKVKVIPMSSSCQCHSELILYLIFYECLSLCKVLASIKRLYFV